MGRRVVLLRGINVGPNKRVPMAELRELFSDAGFSDLRTYVQSGNVVLSSDAAPAELEEQSERLIAERFGFEVPVVSRTRDELAAVVKRNPLGRGRGEPEAIPGELPLGQARRRDRRPARRSRGVDRAVRRRSAASSTRGTRTVSPARSCGRSWPARSSA